MNSFNPSLHSAIPAIRNSTAAIGAVGKFRLPYLRIRPDSMSGMTAVYPQHSLSLCLRSPGGLN
jgi:hypothetical protein